MPIVIAVYPGTFDPLTRGHEDLVRRAAGLFAKLIVGVADKLGQATGVHAGRADRNRPLRCWATTRTSRWSAFEAC